jgi:hypothetical protein
MTALGLSEEQFNDQYVAVVPLLTNDFRESSTRRALPERPRVVSTSTSSAIRWQSVPVCAKAMVQPCLGCVYCNSASRPRTSPPFLRRVSFGNPAEREAQWLIELPGSGSTWTGTLRFTGPILRAEVGHTHGTSLGVTHCDGTS